MTESEGKEGQLQDVITEADRISRSLSRVNGIVLSPKDCEHHARIMDSLRRDLEASRKECEEQARLNGMGSEREAGLLGEVERLKRRAERMEGALRMAGKFLDIFIQGGEWEHEDPECPCDDTCECQNVEEINSVFHEIKALPQNGA